MAELTLLQRRPQRAATQKVVSRKDPIFSNSPGDGTEVLDPQCPIEMGLELGPGWKYLGDHIAPLACRD